ncbi:OmpA family protein [Sagittula sp. S175]|uniref:OmpA family protein n=1 Tax=Sagittula sp. S175 TaxID=3415129 RepID=UPI003C7EB942
MTSITRRLGKALVALLLAQPVAAQDLSLPKSAERTLSTVQDPGAYALPTGAWTNGRMPTARIEGRIEVEAWRVPNSDLSAFQMVQPLRDALAASGYEIVLDCAARACGGFDFRFNTLVVPAPQMYVSLDDYHFISARSPDGAVSVLASRGARDGYVQIVRAGNGVKAAVKTTAAVVMPAEARGLAEALEAEGHVVLPDVIFASGSAALGGGAVGSLDTLAQYLKANPNRRVMIVGHTDATGSLQANRAVSLKRAEAAVAYLTDKGVAATQLQAEGAGYMAPVATNLTEQGREANRRVEAVLLSTD